jgi:hypothetical protein
LAGAAAGRLAAGLRAAAFFATTFLTFLTIFFAFFATRGRALGVAFRARRLADFRAARRGAAFRALLAPERRRAAFFLAMTMSPLSPRLP